MRYIIQNTIISEQILSFCIGHITHAWQQRRTVPFIIADSFALNVRNDISFTHNRAHPRTTHQTARTHNWIRACTCVTLAHLHVWLLAFHHVIPPSIRLLRVWLNTYAKSWHTNNTLIVSRIPRILNTKRFQVNIMSINTDNNIMNIVSFDSEYISSSHHTVCLGLLDPMGQPWNHSYDESGRPQLEPSHTSTQGTPALTFSLPIPNHAFSAICDNIATPIKRLPHNRQRMIIVLVDRIFNRTHFVIAGEYVGVSPTSLIPHHYGCGILNTFGARRGYNSHHIRTDDYQADLFLTFPFAQHTRNGGPTPLHELLLSYQHRPVLTHQDSLSDDYSNRVELLIQHRVTSPITPPLHTINHPI